MDTSDIIQEEHNGTFSSVQTDSPLHLLDSEMRVTDAYGSQLDKSVGDTTMSESIQSFHSTSTNFGRSWSVIELKISS